MSERSSIDEGEMKEEYDFTHSIRNPYARLARGGPLVKLDEDVSQAFTDSESVNAALRLLLKAGRSAVEMAKAS